MPWQDGGYGGYGGGMRYQRSIPGYGAPGGRMGWQQGMGGDPVGDGMQRGIGGMPGRGLGWQGAGGYGGPDGAPQFAAKPGGFDPAMGWMGKQGQSPDGPPSMEPPSLGLPNMGQPMGQVSEAMTSGITDPTMGGMYGFMPPPGGMPSFLNETDKLRMGGGFPSMYPPTTGFRQMPPMGGGWMMPSPGDPFDKAY